MASCIWLAGCAPPATIGLKAQRMHEVPLKIVWLQIPGLSEEHFAFLRFNNISAATVTSFEESTCWGKLWNFNLFHLRPTAAQGLLAQIVGNTNLTGTCADYTRRPLWSYLQELGFKTAVLEIQTPEKSSLAAAAKCTNPDFLKGLSLWRMAKAPTSAKNFFHYQDKKFTWPEGIVYDRSCQQDQCFASPIDNFWYLHERLISSSSYFLLVRDFSYFQALSGHQFKKAQAILAEWEKVYASLLDLAKQDSSVLILLSSTSAFGVEFPAEGKTWQQLEQTGKGIIYHQPNLASLALAAGASAENFCGMYQEASLMERTLWFMNQRGVDKQIMTIQEEKAKSQK
ncbi:MAG: hypothetical protein J6Y94_06470 [Bacteriovoracaceae bacterium]|nr:hypothetical protein [Bacteriovoracaceae bacterium]